MTGQTIECEIPYVKQNIPLIIVFRALGYVPDEEILSYICYDRSDK